MSTYLVVDLDIHDPATFAAYRERVGEFVARHGGEYLARGGETVVHEGDFEPHRVILFRFPNGEAIRRFYADEEYQELAKIRYSSSRTIAFSVDGV
jgi:uncharacterized protein (DUF1330 family)